MALKKYRVRYTDKDDPGSPVFSTILKGHSKEHVDDRFYEEWEPEGWRLVSIQQIKSNPAKKVTTRKTNPKRKRELPPQSVLEKAVREMQNYLAYVADLYAPTVSKRESKATVMKSVRKIAKSTGNTHDNVWNQLEHEAMRRGVKMPLARGMPRNPKKTTPARKANPRRSAAKKNPRRLSALTKV